MHSPVLAQQTFPLLALEARPPGSRRWQGWLLVRPLFWLTDGCLLAVSCPACALGDWERGLLGLFVFLQGLESSQTRAPLCRPHCTSVTSLEAPSPNTVTLAVGASAPDLGGTVQSPAVPLPDHSTPPSSPLPATSPPNQALLDGCVPSRAGAAKASGHSSLDNAGCTLVQVTLLLGQAGRAQSSPLRWSQTSPASCGAGSVLPEQVSRWTGKRGGTRPARRNARESFGMCGVGSPGPRLTSSVVPVQGDPRCPPQSCGVIGGPGAQT